MKTLGAFVTLSKRAAAVLYVAQDEVGSCRSVCVGGGLDAQVVRAMRRLAQFANEYHGRRAQ